MKSLGLAILLSALCVCGVNAADGPPVDDGRPLLAAFDKGIDTHGISLIPSGAAPTIAPPPWDVVETPFPWFASSLADDRPLQHKALLYTLYAIILLICVYTVRHYWFTLNRLFGRQRHPYATLEMTDWPDVTVVVPCHNEEAVVGNILDALLDADYPTDRIVIVPINDRSQDRTDVIIDQYQKRYPGRIKAHHRAGGTPGKAAVLKEALGFVDTEITLVFDADYVPGSDVIKQLVIPFLDPSVGAVMGRVVPVNTDRNLLTRLLEMERAGGYQVDQQARMNLGLVPQYGGTVGGVRTSAVRDLGGWREDSLAEDTEMTFRLVTAGWRIVYSNRYECYEEVPESWPVRIRQIKRWARGHTDAAMSYAWKLVTTRHLPLRVRLDGLMVLGVYGMAPVLLVGWILAITVFYLGLHSMAGVMAILAVASYNTIGNYAAFFEIASAVRLDGQYKRVRLLPLNILGFLVSMVSVTTAIFAQLFGRLRKKEIVWDKTTRFRNGGGD